MSQQGQTIVVYNSQDRPVAVDEAGHLVGGNEYATVVKDSATKAALDAGDLFEKDDPGGQLKGYDPDAKSAFLDAREANAPAPAAAKNAASDDAARSRKED